MGMDNNDMPARPLDHVSSDRLEEGYVYAGTVLTKLEEFTKAAMMGILSNPESASISCGRVPEDALSFALATLEELEKYEKTKVAP